MKALLQRVLEARVRVNGAVVAEIDQGLLVLLGVAAGDAETAASALADKTLALRIFADEHKPMNANVQQIDGAMLVVSQFTLAADVSRGNRPGFSTAAPPEVAEPLYQAYVARLKESGLRVETGVFGADMQVELTNDGPVTFLLER